MLNPAFSKTIANQDDGKFILSPELIQQVLEANEAFDTGSELRLQGIYADEINKKLRSLKLGDLDWANMSVLDICSGTGFLTYHLLKSGHRPEKLTLIDLSNKETEMAKELLGREFPDINISYLVGDVTEMPTDEKFDLIVGNSFLHHLYDLPLAVSSFMEHLNPGGKFVTLHEPLAAAVALESGNSRVVLDLIKYKEKYIDRYRYDGVGIMPNFGSDVWVFSKGNLIDLFSKAGYVNVRAAHWGLLKPYLVARNKLIPTSTSPQLSRYNLVSMKIALALDSVLRFVIPSRWFGSACIIAERPKK